MKRELNLSDCFMMVTYLIFGDSMSNKAKDKSTKHIPIVSAVGAQLFITLILIILLVEACLGIPSNFRTISIIVCSILFFLNPIIFLFSIFLGWNRPLIFTSRGIEKKKMHGSDFLPWENVIKMKVTVRWLGRYYRLKITFNDGYVLSFEPNLWITNDVLRLCPLESIRTMYKDTMKIK